MLISCCHWHPRPPFFHPSNPGFQDNAERGDLLSMYMNVGSGDDETEVTRSFTDDELREVGCSFAVLDGEWWSKGGAVFV